MCVYVCVVAEVSSRGNQPKSKPNIQSLWPSHDSYVCRGGGGG